MSWPLFDHFCGPGINCNIGNESSLMEKIKAKKRREETRNEKQKKESKKTSVPSS